jgi:cephalosporin hydroxylase
MLNQLGAKRYKIQGSLGRSFQSGLPGEVLNRIQSGVLRTTYRGVLFLKSPFDIVIYLQLIDRQRPQTVLEIGTKHGGSALWFADMLSLHGINPQIVSVDISPQATIVDPRITFLQGDALSLGMVLTPELLSELPRPFLVIEDSAHFYETTFAVLEFFDRYLQSGDYLVVEDGIVADLPGEQYAAYQSGPNRAVQDFLQTRGDRYEIDAALCDHFGYNYTYNPNGYLLRR